MSTDPSVADRRVRLFVADDHPLVRDGLRLQIGSAPDLRIVGEAGDGEAAVKEIDRLQGQVDVALLDANMPVMDFTTPNFAAFTQHPNQAVTPPAPSPARSRIPPISRPPRHRARTRSSSAMFSPVPPPIRATARDETSSP